MRGACPLREHASGRSSHIDVRDDQEKDDQSNADMTSHLMVRRWTYQKPLPTGRVV